MRVTKIKENKNKKVFVAISGGVDSSVAALLLKKAGYSVTGIFMKNWSDERFNCSSKEDRISAMRVASDLNIPFKTWNFEKEYKKFVIDYMIEGYKKGITPNPDVMCNKKIKFEIFLKKALKEGADFIATGHYIKIKDSIAYQGSGRQARLKIKDNGLESRVYSLYQAKDKNKDQSYFLWTLTQDQLKYCLFPIGNYLKSEVREIAEQNNLSTARRPDSQGICFVGEVRLKDFLSLYLPQRVGDIINVSGDKLGEHYGAWFYTIGQRHGLGLSGGPYFVISKDIKKNIVYVDRNRQSDYLAKNTILVSEVNWINYQKSNKLLNRIRYRGKLYSCMLKILKDSKLEVRFKKPQWAVASGQSIVFYSRGGQMLGGGVIN